MHVFKSMILTCLILILVSHFLENFYLSLELVSHGYACLLSFKIQTKIFKKFLYLQKYLDLIFWPRSIDQAVDSAYYRPERLTARSTEPLAIGVCMLCTFSVDLLAQRPITLVLIMINSYSYNTNDLVFN